MTTREIAWEFFEEYKKLDSLCQQLLCSKNGVTQYIVELEEVRGLVKRDHYLYVIWRTDVQRLKKMRKIRNVLAHDINAFQEQEIAEEDIIWLKNFYRRIIEQEDVFSLLNKKKEDEMYHKSNAWDNVWQMFVSAVIVAVSLLLITGVAFLLLWNEGERSQHPISTEQKKDIICIDSLTFERQNRNEILLTWSDELDIYVEGYDVKRRDTFMGEGIGEWISIANIKSDHFINGINWMYVDYIDADEYKQYEYRIDIILSDISLEESLFAPQEGEPILASNVKVCIDPGHFHKPGEVTEADEYAYIEGDFMLEVALELKECLRLQYGIDVCLTRESDVIELNGFRNEELDSAHISLRGEYAAKEDCDLFVSLHSNSNEEGANGCETFFQPLAINKSMVIVNTAALHSAVAMDAANVIGAKLSCANFELGLAETDDFVCVTADTVAEWSKEYNDGLGEVGTVVIRRGKKDPDFYGVLRGAVNAGVPGMIIEHGYHSVESVRQAARMGDLKDVWANADACGIAYGFGFTR